MDLNDDNGSAKPATAKPTPQHTAIIILGALALLWFLGAVAFKGIRQ